MSYFHCVLAPVSSIKVQGRWRLLLSFHFLSTLISLVLSSTFHRWHSLDNCSNPTCSNCLQRPGIYLRWFRLELMLHRSNRFLNVFYYSFDSILVAASCSRSSVPNAVSISSVYCISQGFLDDLHQYLRTYEFNRFFSDVLPIKIFRGRLFCLVS